MKDTDRKRIDHILGGYGAGRMVRQMIEAFQRDDHLPEPAAMKLACARLADCSPWLIAAPGQTWRLRRDHVSTTEHPRLLRVMTVRRASGVRGVFGAPAVHYADAEFAPWRAEAWMPLADLAANYSLEDWPRPRAPRVTDDGAAWPDCSPWLIAAPGQTWRLRRDHVSTTEHPRLLRVMTVRRTGGAEDAPAVRCADAESAPWRAGSWMLFADLVANYSLEQWPHRRAPRVIDNGGPDSP